MRFDEHDKRRALEVAHYVAYSLVFLAAVALGYYWQVKYGL